MRKNENTGAVSISERNFSLLCHCNRPFGDVINAIDMSEAGGPSETERFSLLPMNLQTQCDAGAALQQDAGVQSAGEHLHTRSGAQVWGGDTSGRLLLRTYLTSSFRVVRRSRMYARPVATWNSWLLSPPHKSWGSLIKVCSSSERRSM